MQLTRFSDLGLRVLIYLTRHERSLPVTIAEIAAQFGAPRNHLMKVVNRLGHLGVVTTLRGRGGGLRLALPASELHIGQILRALEEHGPLVDCASCVLNGACLLRGALDEALDAFYARLDQYSLADVSQRQTGQAILQMHQRFLAAHEGDDIRGGKAG